MTFSKFVRQDREGEQRLGGKPPWDWSYMNEEESSLQLIPLIEMEDIWRLLLYDGVLGTLELLQQDAWIG